MTFTKIENGKYTFKGIDTWTNKEIEGNIIYQPYDVKSNQVWQVVFGLGTMNVDRPFMASTLKECKKWLTDTPTNTNQ
jgi:hypothetical protein